MAIVANTFLTFSTIGIREELADKISNIAPWETPVLNMSSKGSMSNTYTEWQQDTLVAASTTNAQLEGDDIATFTAVVPTVRLGCHAQILRKTLIIAATDEAVDRAGRKSEAAYQVMLMGRALKTDLEATIVSKQIDATGNSTTARQLPGLAAWIKTNTSKGAAGVDPVYTSTPNNARADGTLRTLTEAFVKTVIQAQWTVGGKCDTVVASPLQKVAISGFAGISTKYNELGLTGKKPGTTFGAVDSYVSDFGTFSIVPDRYVRDRDVFILDGDMLEVADLRGTRVIPLAKTGDAEKAMMLRECTFKVLNEKGIGAVYDVQ